MHLSIPDSNEWFADPERKRGQYTAFNLYCNGVYHCSVRFSQLHKLNEAVRKQYPAAEFLPFPPKKIFALTDAELDQRRVMLEKYIQKITDMPQIVSGAVFTTFLLEAQDEVKSACEEVELEVFLVNGKSVTLDGLSTDQTDEVLETLSEKIDLQSDLTYYFGLVVVEDKAEGKGTDIVRTVQHFESPYISLSRSKNEKQHIQIRKAYWDITLDEAMMDDPVALNLLYLEAIQHIKSKCIEVPADKKAALGELKSSGDKEGFVKACQQLKGYGFWQWPECVCSFPEGGTKASVRIGSKMLTATLEDGKELVFPVTRMRCWRVSHSEEEPDKLELSFHFLKAKDELVWVKIQSDAAILMSMCLQSVVDELIRLRNKRAVKTPQAREKRQKPTEVRSTAVADKPAAVVLTEEAEKAKKEAPDGGDGEASSTSFTAAKGEEKKSFLGFAKSKDKAAEPAASPANEAFNTSIEENAQVFGDIGDDDL